MLFLETETAKQNQKISFPFLFPLRGGGVGGGDARKMQGNFFGFCTRESASVSEAHWFASPGNRSVRFGSKPPRAPRVRISQNPADFSRNTFELRPIHTANILFICLVWLPTVIQFCMSQTSHRSSRFMSPPLGLPKR